jgi:peptide/nickel transport system substrate-binding protein
LTLPLREGVSWHDGRPFTAKDVQCTWDMLTGKASEKLRVNPRKSWYGNLDSVTSNGDYEVTFHLKRPQPAFYCVARCGVFAGLSLPCAAARYAQPSDRHRTVQIRRVQAERTYPRCAQPGLLEEGPALSRRHRVYDYPQSLDGGIGVRCRKVRYDFLV